MKNGVLSNFTCKRSRVLYINCNLLIATNTSFAKLREISIGGKFLNLMLKLVIPLTFLECRVAIIICQLFISEGS